MTVGQLRAQLAPFLDTDTVQGLWDSMLWDVHRVVRHPAQPTVVILDVGNGEDGEWDETFGNGGNDDLRS